MAVSNFGNIGDNTLAGYATASGVSYSVPVNLTAGLYAISSSAAITATASPRYPALSLTLLTKSASAINLSSSAGYSSILLTSDVFNVIYSTDTPQTRFIINKLGTFKEGRTATLDTITTSGSYVFPPGLTRVLLIGGGGSGGAGIYFPQSWPGNVSGLTGAGGGGSGYAATGQYISIGASVSITLGAGGSGGTTRFNELSAAGGGNGGPAPYYAGSGGAGGAGGSGGGGGGGYNGGAGGAGGSNGSAGSAALGGAGGGSGFTINLFHPSIVPTSSGIYGGGSGGSGTAQNPGATAPAGEPGGGGVPAPAGGHGRVFMLRWW